MSRPALYNIWRPNSWDSIVEQDAVKQIISQQIKEDNLKRVLLFTGGAGTGKAQPLYSKILTPTGFITMGDVKLGDVVFTARGNLAIVTEIYPQGRRPIYEITLQDKTKIRVADNHLNCVWHYNQSKKQREDFVLTTTDLIEKFKTQRYKLRVDTPSVDFKHQDVLIDPYLLGVLIGDGGLAGGSPKFSSVEQDIIQKVDDIVHRDYNMYVSKKSGARCDYNIKYIENPGHNGSKGDKGLHELVRNYDPLTTLSGQLIYYGLNCKSVEKHIPKEYLFNDRDTRLKLLQGLYDTDGWKGGRNFCISSKQLAKDFAFLVRSLGIRATLKTGIGKYNGKECHPYYSFHLKPPMDMRIFSSKKHHENYKPQQHDPMRNIVSIEYIGEEECQCIMVDHDDHTYISDDFIPTHNTTSARVLARDIEKEPSNIVEINCADHTGVDDVRQLVIDASRTRPLTGKYKIFVLDEVHMLTVQAQNALLKILEEPPSHCIYILCTTDPQKILGTIMSRAFRYDFQLISLPGIIARLKYILGEEKKLGPDGCGVQSWDDGAIEAIAISANGHLRNAIATLEKVISYSRDITLDVVTKVLGTTNYDTLFYVLDSILNKQESNLINQLEEINNSGMDLKLFIKNFLAFIIEINKYVIIKAETGQSVVPQSLPSSYSQRLMVYNASHKEVLKHLLKTMLELNSEIRWETNVKPVLETKLLLEVL